MGRCCCGKALIYAAWMVHSDSLIEGIIGEFELPNEGDDLFIRLRKLSMRHLECNIGIIQRMSTRLRYKIISCSSQEPQHPVSSLLTSTPGWYSQRFCNYPQQITIQFNSVVSVSKIELVSDHQKISSQVDILYYSPSDSPDNRFYKYGYLQFNRHNQSSRELKTISVDMDCLYLRLLLYKAYPSRENFFSQVGLHSLVIHGQERGLQERGALSAINQTNEDDPYIIQKLEELNARKEKAVEQEDFENATVLKSCIEQVKKLRTQIQLLKAKKSQAVEHQNYSLANQIKNKIEEDKRDVDALLREIMDDGAQYTQGRNQEYNQGRNQGRNQGHNQRQSRGNNHAQTQKYSLSNNSRMINSHLQSVHEALQDNQFADNDFIEVSRVSRVSKRSKGSRVKELSEIKRKVDAYDEKIVPAALKQQGGKTEPSEENDKFVRVEHKLQEIQGKYTKDASMMQEHFKEETVKKFFSRHWEHKFEALNEIVGEKKEGGDMLRCLLMIVINSIKENNFQVCQGSLNVLRMLLKLRGGRAHEMSNDLQSVLREVVKKLSDNNGKLKAQAEAVFEEMVESGLYGVAVCSMGLVATHKIKLSQKQVASRLVELGKIFKKYNLESGTGNGKEIPLEAVDFVVAQLDHPAAQIKNQAILALSLAYRKDKNKVQPKLANVKESVMQKIIQGTPDPQKSPQGKVNKMTPKVNKKK